MKRSSPKILLAVHKFFPRHYHGTERYTLELAKSLQATGYEVIVVTVNHHLEDSTGKPWIDYVYEGVRVLAIDLTRLPGSSFRYSYDRPHINGVFRRILSEERPDLVHCCHILDLGATIIGVAKEAKLPVVFSLTDFFGICFTNRLATLYGRPCDGPRQNSVNCVADFYSGVFRQSSSVIGGQLRTLGTYTPEFLWVLFEKCVSSHMARRFLPRFGDIQRRNERLFKYYQHVDVYLVATDFLRDAYVRHGFPADRFKKITFGITQPTDAERNALEKRYWELDDETPFVFGYIGQIARHKGVDLLVKAFQKAKLPNAELHIHGALDQERDIGNYIRAAAMSNHRIKCPGTFPGKEIYDKLSSIHALCIPSQWAENAPLVLFNGLASKTFLIVSQGKGLAEFVQEGAQGIAFETSSADSLSAAMTEVYHRREGLFDKCRVFPVTLFLRTITQRKLAAFIELLQGVGSVSSVASAADIW